MTRPGPLHWLRHAFGANLGPRYAEWALFDASTRLWWWRYMAALLVRVSPVVLALVAGLTALGGSVGLVIASVGLGLIVVVYFGGTYAVDAIDSRLAAYGYERGSAAKARADRKQ